MGVGAEVCRLAPGDDAMNGAGKTGKAMVGLFAAAAARPTAYQGIYRDFVVAGEAPPGEAGAPRSREALAREAGLPPEITALLVQSGARSDALAELEADAMAAVGRGDLEGARRILTGAD